MKPRPFSVEQRLMPLLQKGMKTQWRSPITASNSGFSSAPVDYWAHADFGLAKPDGWSAEHPGEVLRVPCAHNHGDCRRCDAMGWPETVHRLYPRTLRDQILWVQEAWAYWKGAPLAEGRFVANPKTAAPAVWAVDFGGRRGPHVSAWRPSPQMPVWVSRYTMRVASVRIERLHEITEEDARAEGMIPYQGGWVSALPWEGAALTTAREAFMWDWEARRGRGKWRVNPWVIRMQCDVHPGNVVVLEKRLRSGEAADE